MDANEPRTRMEAAFGERTSHPEREYRRALRDFAELTQHRLASRLTSITAGITALQELDDHLDPEIRHEVLAALQRTASELEVAVIHPELANDGDGDGVVPRMDGADLAELLVADVVHAEQHARSINERLFMQVASSPEAPVDFLCECWAIECSATVTLPMADYWIVHARHDQFVVAPGHDLPSLEQVVERHGDWWVVRTTSEALRTALDRRLRTLG